MKSAWITIFILVTMTGCECGGIWTERDKYGVLNKYNNYWHKGLNSCVTSRWSLTNWEKTQESRYQKGVTCTPQPSLPSMYLKSNNNFYSYRDDKMFIHLDSNTGIGTRLILGERGGTPIFSRQEFCYYVRQDLEVEPVNPANYGTQILFDLELAASSDTFHPMEIFTYTDLGAGNHSFYRFDNNVDIDWKFCPVRITPYGFCNLLRNGNSMYYPDGLTNGQKAALVNEASLIRAEYNFTNIAQAEFNSIFSTAITSYVEAGTYNYMNLNHNSYNIVNTIPDEPPNVGRAWREYLRGERAYMPDVSSALLKYPLCYDGRKEVTFADGSKGLIYGQVCYEDSDYYFIEY